MMTFPAKSSKPDVGASDSFPAEGTLQDGPVPEPWGGLRFSEETAALKTEFRANVLNRIYCAALGLCNGRLECAEVALGTSAEEEGWLVFDLIITVDTDWDNIEAIEGRLSEMIAEWSSEWNEEEIEDYSSYIYFGMIPSKL
ncbi:MAG: hypothetical protein OXI91_10915 [Chloroflexota bacterium]|nr:hypothetical protein [Chloroflexota bacterium]